MFRIGFQANFARIAKKIEKINTAQKIVPIAGDVRLLLARIISYVFKILIKKSCNQPLQDFSTF